MISVLVSYAEREKGVLDRLLGWVNVGFEPNLTDAAGCSKVGCAKIS